MPDKTRRSFVTTSAAACGAFVQAGSPEKQGSLFAYVGTFSSPLKNVLPTQVDLPPGNGRGIHIFRADRHTGALMPAGIMEMGTSPSCLVANREGTRIYSANETDRQGAAGHGSVSAFAIDKLSGRLDLLGTVGSGGAGPTFVSIHPNGRYIFVANYFGGSVSVIPIGAEGKLGTATDTRDDTGKIGPAKAANAPPGSFAFSGHDRTHAHQILPDSSGKFVLHVDLGLDSIFVWRFDDASGKLHPADFHKVALPPGDGPRHFHFHPNGKWFYSIQEEGSTIVLFDYDGSTGKLTPRQTISTLPKGYAGSNFCSEILVSDDGRHVYAGNRLHDSIGVFSIGQGGTLTHLADEWTRGNYPRSFSFDPSGKFLYCCNQRADHITVFKVDNATGLLAFTGTYVPVGNPSMVLFVDTARGG